MQHSRVLTLTLAALLVAAVLAGCSTPTFETPKRTLTPYETVVFPDANLEKAIREALGKPAGEQIIAADLDKLTSLCAGFYGIGDLSGLENCTNLTELSIAGCNVSDISCLSSLTNLRVLSLSGNPISDISPLSSLTNLTMLALAAAQIHDISPLASLPNLKELHIWGNQISDISPLVKNQGLAAGDIVDLRINPLSKKSVNTYIPQLKARGVEVSY